jgi:hypothetical protein
MTKDQLRVEMQTMTHGHHSCNDLFEQIWQAALESRVLAERKPIYQVLEPCEASWQDVDWLTYESTDGAFKRIVYDAHPTPDDAALMDDLRKFLDVAAGQGYQFDGVDADDLYLRLFPDAFDAAIDRARQSGEEGKS